MWTPHLPIMPSPSKLCESPTKHYVVAGAFRRMPNNVNSSAAPAVTVKSTNPMV